MTYLPQFWRSNFLIVEFILSILLGLIFIIWSEYLGGSEHIENLLSGNKSAVYGTLASIFGSLLGFAITATSIVLGFSGSPRLEIVRQSIHYSTLWDVFGATIRSLGGATIASLAGLILDRECDSTRWVLYLTFFTSLLAGLRLLRSVWVLENIIALLTAPPKEREGADPIEG